jgi:hypothetical protein
MDAAFGMKDQAATPPNAAVIFAGALRVCPESLGWIA